MGDKGEIEIYVPLSSCSCSFAKFMDKVWSVIIDYMEDINYKVLNSQSREAYQKGILGNGLIINGTKKFSSTFKEDDLRQALEEEIARSGL